MRKRNETHEKRSREDEKAAKRAAKGMRPLAQAVTASATAATLVAPADDNRLEVRIFNGNAAGGADIVIGINSTVGTTGGPAGWPIPPQMTFVDDRSNGLTIGGKNGVDSQDAEAAKDGRLSSFVRSSACEKERDSSFLIMQKLFNIY